MTRVRRQVADKEIREAVIEHLRNLVATRQTSALSAPDYGMPDILETLHSYPKTVTALAEALSHAIRKYEPRLTNVRVTYVPDPRGDLILRYDVSAQLVGSDERKTPITFETRIDASRRVSIT